MKELLAIFMLAAVPFTSQGAGGGDHPLQAANIDVSNHAAIQRGAKMFVNYCMGCHSAKYVRYKQLTKVGLSEDVIKRNLMFGGGKIGDQMTIAMPQTDAANWFGAAAPDLTLISRIKHGGPDWLFSYLKSFYSDESRPMGVNNTVFPNVGMPNVLAELQGIQKAVYKEEDHGGHVVKVVDHLELVEPGSLTPAEFDSAVRDLATFLAYIAEPIKVKRQGLGLWVILFLVVFTVLAYFMKKSYWKDVH
jgi:ubiquinol-cytochrome c reductase cytochrome c1 subunit